MYIFPDVLTFIIILHAGTGENTGRTTAPIAAFVCNAGEVVEIVDLCDGIANCGGGDDESTPICESTFLTLLPALYII